ncbi:hypothetical protein CVT26_003923 [Gymnopilus dilepis]|uniref:Uncharacterized protein n=1 Tax=Gymnopilus dilepis TaxID=231916 RepID=A0A409YUU6_9AGAR|nr:hypothetical protein CVT26_003923 [Gymnopilus dilepis]
MVQAQLDQSEEEARKEGPTTKAQEWGDGGKENVDSGYRLQLYITIAKKSTRVGEHVPLFPQIDMRQALCCVHGVPIGLSGAEFVLQTASFDEAQGGGFGKKSTS